MARRGENIYKRKDGRFEGRYVVGRKPDRTSKFGYVYGRSYGEVKAKLQPLKRMFQRPQNVSGFRGIFADYAVNWLNRTVHEKDIKASTYSSYYRMTHNHIIPALGGSFPHLIRKSDVRDFMYHLKGKGLSDGSVANILRLLAAMLKSAREENIVVEDACAGIQMPSSKRRKISVLTRTEQAQLERTCAQEKAGIVALLALYTGMRVGEISALKWSDIDLNEGLLYVRETAQRVTKYGAAGAKTRLYFERPKTASSERVIALPKNLTAYLRKHRAAAKGDYVVSCKGGVAEPRVCQYRFKVLLEKACVKPVNFHALRHTYATRCMEEGMDVKTLSQLMGHAQASMTLRYGDSLTEHKKRAVMALDKVYQVAI